MLYTESVKNLDKRRRVLKKFMMLAAMLALALVVVAVPAIAQVGAGGGNEAESGGVELEFSVENTGDYASQCTPALQFGNTGNFQNTPVFQQYASKADDFEPGGIEFVVEPETAVECDSTIQQSAAASGG
jgi:hypothetical protein